MPVSARARYLSNHQPRTLDPALEEELDAFRQQVAARSLEEFYSGEMDEYQDWANINCRVSCRRYAESHPPRLNYPFF